MDNVTQIGTEKGGGGDKANLSQHKGYMYLGHPNTIEYYQSSQQIWMTWPNWKMLGFIYLFIYSFNLCTSRKMCMSCYVCTVEDKL